MLSFVRDVLSLLRAHPLVQSLRVVHYDETPAGKMELKVRCRLPGGYRFQVWLHDEPGFQDYAYQLLVTTHFSDGTTRLIIPMLPPLRTIFMMRPAMSASRCYTGTP